MPVGRLFWPRLGPLVKRPSWAGRVPLPMRDDEWFWSLASASAAYCRALAVGVPFLVAGGLLGWAIGDMVGLAVAAPWLAFAFVAWARLFPVMARLWTAQKRWTWRARVSTWHLRAPLLLLIHPR